VSKEFKVGIIITAAIAVTIIGINYLKGERFFAKQRVYHSIYEHIDGLAPSNPVISNGFKVGLVRTIEMHPDGSGRLIVTYAVNQPDLIIPEDSEAKIFSSDILGSKAIELMIGNSAVPAESGMELTGTLEQDFTSVIKAEFEPLRKRTESLVKDLDDILSNIKALFDDENTQSIPESFLSLQRSLKTLESTALTVDQMVKENQTRFKSIMTNVDNISGNLASNNQKINNIIANLNQLSDSLAAIEFAQTMSKVDKAMGDFATTMEKINKGEGTLGQLATNDSMYNNLNAASLALDRLLDDMRVNPSRYVTFSLISRKDKDGFTKQEREEIRKEVNKALKEGGGK
jgi:phospholipid/cholesterol/gamma-HCH transport system substrate-binding protein